jgi:carbon storage regulator CsrA
MLVLTRKIEEEIVIGDNIHLKVLRIKGHAVQIGITAPASVHVARSELLPAMVFSSEVGLKAGGSERLALRQGNRRPVANQPREVNLVPSNSGGQHYVHS